MAGVLSIDPGAVSAAWAHHNVIVQCNDVPVAAGMVDAVSFADIVRGLKPTVAVLEQVGSMPKQGVASTFKFGMGYGLLRGVLCALQVPIVLVHASRWKRALRLPSADKEEARALAIRTYPKLAEQLKRKKDAGRAEALLIGHWYLHIHSANETI